jgi:quercetin dioxygenase-like cupin family protein
MDNAQFSTATYDAFRRRALEGGADEVVERTWRPHQVVERHSHPFDAEVVVTAGEMWLTRDDGREQRFGPGDAFRLPAGAPHAERCGPEGATCRIARRAPG